MAQLILKITKSIYLVITRYDLRKISVKEYRFTQQNKYWCNTAFKIKNAKKNWDEREKEAILEREKENKKYSAKRDRGIESSFDSLNMAETWTGRETEMDVEEKKIWKEENTIFIENEGI